MADKAGQADIRGINVQKYATAYLDEALIFKKLCFQRTTSNREIRWYQKTATSPVAEANTGDTSNVAYGAAPFVVHQSFTRNTSYTKKYMLDSELIPQEDLKDNDVNILSVYVEDLTYRIAYNIDGDIWDVVTENQSASSINSNTSTAAWDDTGQDPIDDLMEGMENIRVNSGYDPQKYGGVLLLSPKDHRSLLDWLINTKGSSIPSFSSERVKDGVVMEILGLKVMVSNNVTADYAAIVIPQKAASWYSFGEIQTRLIEEEGIGTKIRIWAEGLATLDRPKCVNLITNTQT